MVVSATNLGTHAAPTVPSGFRAIDPVVAVIDAPAVRAVLDGGTVRPVFQPIVDLTTSGVRAFEALARGPEGHRLERPDALFAAARARGVLPAVDVACIASALQAARDSGLEESQTLFVNIEPDSGIIDVLPRIAGSVPFQVVIELTERALAVDPAQVLATVDMIHRCGWGVALDDVGVNPDSLALLPVISPDVIKLDISLLQLPPSEHTAHVFSAVAAETERSGCLVVAEGIETAAHVQAARALGAHLGQGWFFGRPGPLPVEIDQPIADRLSLRAHLPAGDQRTPFTVVSAERDIRASTKPLLTAMSKHLEREATAIGESCLILATFQTAEAFAPAADRYCAMAEKNAFVAAFGRGIAPMPAPLVHGVDLVVDEPLCREWTVVVIGPHYAVVLAAQLIDDGSDEDQNWNDVLSYDRAIAVRAATALMVRMTRTPAP